MTQVPLTALRERLRKRPEGSGTSAMPSPVISKHPTSSVGPKRFLSARTKRSAVCRSPSNWQTTSTRCSRRRGPAIVPSFVTWPTRSTGRLRSFATRMSVEATSRTWLRLAGQAVGQRARHGLHGVDDEQFGGDLRRPGRGSWRGRSRRRGTARRGGRPCGRRGAGPGRWTPRRSRRARGGRVAATRAATSRSSVDLPTPGSPESRMAAPATMPPPSTRSNSPMPLGRCAACCISTSPIGLAARAAVGTTACSERTMPVCSAASTTVPHCWHSAHRPTHFTVLQPHSVHRNAEVGLAMP